MNFDNMSDEEILRFANDGNSSAIDFIFEKYRNFVRAKSRTYFLIGADNEDIIQEGMIGLYKAIRDYKSDMGTNFKTFADLCITRQIISAIKNATRQKHIPLNSYISLNKPTYDDEDNALLNSISESSHLDPEEIMIEQERIHTIERKISDILSRFESKVLSRYLDGKSYCVIAYELSKPEKSIDNALQRIKKKINKMIESSEELK